MSDPPTPPQDYPPAEHVLRDLRLWSDSASEPPRAGLPVSGALHGAAGACATGVLAVLVDVVAGGAALRAADEGWIATSDLQVHWLEPVASGDLVASAEALRSGRTSIVVEVSVEAAGRRVGFGRVGFSRLEAKGDYQRRPRTARSGRVDWGAGQAGFREPWAERIGALVRAPAEGLLELPVTPYVGNSLGGLQGGIAVALLDFAAEAAANARGGTRLATRDLAVHFLSIARRGPVRTRAEVLRRDAAGCLLRVEARDAGADDRLTTVATASLAAG
ncbi:MAG: hotdog fold thioesterase [Myxococcota bacterium]